MSLFGEESYEDQETPSMQLGPVWAPSWFASADTAPDSPSSSAQAQGGSQQPDGQQAQLHGEARQPNMDLQQQQQQQQQQHQQASLSADMHAAAWSVPIHDQAAASAAPYTVSLPATVAVNPQGHWWAGSIQALPDETAETASDFGSFTAGSPVTRPVAGTFPSQLSIPGQGHTLAQDLRTDWTGSQYELTEAPASAASDSPRAYRPNSSALRPAAAAARESVLQSMNRSVPISLDTFGQGEVEDADLQLPNQVAAVLPYTVPPQAQAAAALSADLSSFQSGRFHPEFASQQSESDFAPFQTSTSGTDQQLAAIWHQSSLQDTEAASPTDFQTAGGFSATWPVAGNAAELPASMQRLAASGPVIFGAFGNTDQADPAGVPSTPDCIVVFLPVSSLGLRPSTTAQYVICTRIMVLLPFI